MHGVLDPAEAEQAVAWLVDRAVDDPDQAVQEAALNALVSAHDGYDLPLRLFSRLRSELGTLPPVLAEYALYILAATHDLTVRPDIEAYLLHPDPAAYDVVNVSRPASRFFRSSGSSPGSKNGATPSAALATLAASASRPMTSCPRSAMQTA